MLGNRQYISDIHVSQWRFSFSKAIAWKTKAAKSSVYFSCAIENVYSTLTWTIVVSKVYPDNVTGPDKDPLALSGSWYIPVPGYHLPVPLGTLKPYPAHGMYPRTWLPITGPDRDP